VYQANVSYSEPVLCRANVLLIYVRAKEPRE